ncbi:hypothetical protein A2U01_0030422, partial [Trifolium medium]|nr:hypothetical protein [Trifolium medium]
MEQGGERMTRRTSANGNRIRCSPKIHGTTIMKIHLSKCRAYPLSLRNNHTETVLQFPTAEEIDLVVVNRLKDLHRSVSSVRNAVRFVRSSPRRATKFKECIEFAAAFDKLKDADAAYMDFFDGDDSPPSNFDWENARAFVKFVKHFFEATKVFSLNGLVGSSSSAGSGQQSS